jgi:hypothetical protein
MAGIGVVSLSRSNFKVRTKSTNNVIVYEERENYTKGDVLYYSIDLILFFFFICPGFPPAHLYM